MQTIGCKCFEIDIRHSGRSDYEKAAFIGRMSGQVDGAISLICIIAAVKQRHEKPVQRCAADTTIIKLDELGDITAGRVSINLIDREDRVRGYKRIAVNLGPWREQRTFSIGRIRVLNEFAGQVRVTSDRVRSGQLDGDVTSSSRSNHGRSSVAQRL